MNIMHEATELCPVELVVPAERNMMLVIRLTTAGVLARAGLTVDVMDDVTLAVEEACNCLIGQGESPRKIRLRFSRLKDALQISVCYLCDGEDGMCGMDAGELDVVYAILESMVDAVKIEETDGLIHAICLQKKIAC